MEVLAGSVAVGEWGSWRLGARRHTWGLSVRGSGEHLGHAQARHGQGSTQALGTSTLVLKLQK